jgi:hypothetical protein
LARDDLGAATQMLVDDYASLSAGRKAV